MNIGARALGQHRSALLCSDHNLSGSIKLQCFCVQSKQCNQSNERPEHSEENKGEDSEVYSPLKSGRTGLIGQTGGEFQLNQKQCNQGELRRPGMVLDGTRPQSDR